MDENIIKTVKMVAGNRIYFMDIKKNSKNSAYLSISEKEFFENGQSRRSKIIVFNEYWPVFLENIQKLLENKY